MSFYGSMKIAHIKAATEEKLQLLFRDLEIEHDGMIKVINIYRSGSFVVGWYYHDFKRAGVPKPQKKVTKKKVSKKKVVKKVGS